MRSSTPSDLRFTPSFIVQQQALALESAVIRELRHLEHVVDGCLERFTWKTCMRRECLDLQHYVTKPVASFSKSVQVERPDMRTEQVFRNLFELGNRRLRVQLESEEHQCDQSARAGTSGQIEDIARLRDARLSSSLVELLLQLGHDPVEDEQAGYALDTTAVKAEQYLSLGRCRIARHSHGCSCPLVSSNVECGEPV